MSYLGNRMLTVFSDAFYLHRLYFVKKEQNELNVSKLRHAVTNFYYRVMMTLIYLHTSMSLFNEETTLCFWKKNIFTKI